TYCPFCEGSENNTPHEILAYRDRNTRSNEKGWRVRVVPNKFPALQIEGDLHKRGDGIYDKMNGIGAHEVIIECPFHEISMANLTEDNIREVLWVYRDRLVDLKKDPRLVYGMVFKNVGAAAGASLEHSHSQLIVTPIVPINVWAVVPILQPPRGWTVTRACRNVQYQGTSSRPPPASESRRCM